MKNSADIVIALQSNDSLNRKREILQEAWALGHREFFLGVQLCYDALKTFGVKQIPLIDGDDDGTDDFSWQDFENLSQQLIARKLTGNAARAALANAANRCNVHMWNNFYRRILIKDMKCKTTDTVINQELEKIAALSSDANNYIVPVFSCQLASSGDDHEKKLVGLKLIDHKLDGVRLLTVIDVENQTIIQYTRNGIINDRFTIISENLAPLLSALNESIVLDGEVMSTNFQALMTQVNRKKLVDTTDSVLHLFDCIPLADFKIGKSNIKQSDRHIQLIAIVNHLNSDIIKVVPKMLVNLSTPEGQKNLQDFNREAIDSGYEGIMIKNPNAPYECKRRTHWLKIKPWITVDLEIIGYEQGNADKKYEKTLGNLLCRGYDNGKLIETSVGYGFSDERRDELWASRETLIGQIVEIKADGITKSQKGDSYSLRFPAFLRFRGIEPHEKF